MGSHLLRQITARLWALADEVFGGSKIDDKKVQDIAIAMIRRNSMNPDEWNSTIVGALHPRIGERLRLLPNELILISAYFSDASWYAFTTRRVVSCVGGKVRTLDPRRGLESDFGNFKGSPLTLDQIPTEVATIRSLASGLTLQLEYETGKPSMGPINAAKYWSKKHPILDKLLTSAELESYRSRRS